MAQGLTPLPENKFEANQPEQLPGNVNLPNKTVESLSLPEQEKVAEKSQNTENINLADEAGEGELGLVVGGVQNSATFQKRLKKIEETLEKDLSELYLAMPENKKLEFKIAGEETARKINQILSQAKFKIQAIISLIKKWLSLLPGANQFFIEQETKIKTDEIIRLNELK